MTNINRWIDEMPDDSPDRVLLDAGKSARPPEGSKEAAWRAISLSLGAAATAATLSTQASSALSANTSAGAVIAAQASAAKGVVSATVLSIGIKSVAIGFAVGVGLLGAGEVVDRVTDQAPTASISHVNSAARAVASQRALTQTLTSSHVAAPEPAAIASSEKLPEARIGRLHAVTTQPRPTDSVVARDDPALTTRASSAQVAAQQNVAAAPDPHSLPDAKSNSLAEQARELAQIQRMLGAGASTEAIRQLEASIASDPQSGLSEERDALYVQALVNAQRTTQATSLARRFVKKYPNSPHVEKMRRVLNVE